MRTKIYDKPKYYEIAFSFINPQKQVDLFEQFIKKFSKIKVKSVLDIACGPALQLRELAKRGYESIGLDASPKMLDYLKSESIKKHLEVKTIKADMNNFKLKNKVDFVYIMMGSIVYAKNNKLLLSHLNSISGSLKAGGLYVIENLNIDWTNPKFWNPQSWTINKGGIKIKTTYQLTAENLLSQSAIQTITLKIKDNGKIMEFKDKEEVKIIFPEEFKLLIDKNGKFEFIGFFERNKFRPLKKISSNNIVLLRKK